MSKCFKPEELGRRNAIPIIYTSGTYYEVGFDVVSTNIIFLCLNYSNTYFFFKTHFFCKYTNLENLFIKLLYPLIKLLFISN